MRKSTTASERMNNFIAEMTAKLTAFAAAGILFLGFVAGAIVSFSAILGEGPDPILGALTGVGIFVGCLLATILVFGTLAVLLDIRAAIRTLAESSDASKSKGKESSTSKGILGIGGS